MESIDNIVIVEPSVEVVTPKNYFNFGVGVVDKMGRICWQSEPKENDSPADFAARLIGKHHESVLEHTFLSAIFITDRAVSHQLVRHRLCAFSQESQRYVRYKTAEELDNCLMDNLNKDISFKKKFAICKQQMFENDSFKNSDYSKKFFENISNSFKIYEEGLKLGYRPEELRAIFPNCTKTQIGMTANLREWRHIFKERLSSAAQNNIRALFLPLFLEMKNLWPQLFFDIQESDKDVKFHANLKWEN